MEMNQKRKVQILGILLLAFGLMYFISLVGHAASDDLQITSDEAAYGNPFTLDYTNPGGMMGAYLSYVAAFFLGYSMYFSAILLIVLGVRIIGFDLGRRLLKHAAMTWALAFELLVLIDIPRTALGAVGEEVPDGVGALGQALITLLVKLVGIPGSYIMTLAAIACTMVFYASISHRFRNAITALGRKLGAILKQVLADAKPKLVGMLKARAKRRGSEFDRELDQAIEAEEKSGRRGANGGDDEANGEAEDRIILPPSLERPKSVDFRTKRKVTLSGKSEPDADANGNIDLAEGASPEQFVIPGLELLSDAQSGSGYDEKELAETAKSLRETLETFGVKLDGNIEMYPGPVITRFEVRPAAGIKVNQIANLSDDLALNLRAKSIRIVAPVPGKAAVGIEIPNRNPQMVYIREILASDNFQKNRYHLPLAFGKDISGRPYVTDLAVMPHLLIAGTTGSGKSVCINVIITSLIYSLHPDRVKFIFVDPKMLELSVYKGIPHLAEQVVTNPKQAERVLNDVVVEMEHRYKTLAAAAVRSIVDYNQKQKSDEEKLPYIVIVIDELADLMMSTHSSRVELLITRLAQMARAVGIHLIVATQRPSVDVITGLIKANFPSRIAFQVATKTDSRTILDGNGAERLLGRGDMLFLEVGSPEPVRLHGAYISSEETENLVAFIKSQPYSQTRTQEAEAAAEEKASLRQLTDPVLLEAIETVIQHGQASVSLLQRKLGIGYQRAARLIDELEAMKVIGSYNESKAREVLADRAFLENLKNGKISKP
jgi:S-DNA-T family DNA segregation ATPase FtsK/SpoIIIE